MAKQIRDNDDLPSFENAKDSEEIKGELANMDCCGDDLCGTPQKYTDKITKILNSKVDK